MPDLSTPLLDATNNRLNKPDVRCDAVGSTPANEPKPLPPPSTVLMPEPTPTAPLVTPKPGREPEPTPMAPLVTPKPSRLEQPFSPTINDQAQISKPSPIPTKGGVSQENNLSSFFYPNFGNDGSPVGCMSDGNAPKWMTSDMMRSSREGCCSTYFSSPASDRCNANYPFYPNFDSKSCVNDGNHPSWMAGDYLTDSKWTCCRNFFRDKKVLEKCAEAKHVEQ